MLLISLVKGVFLGSSICLMSHIADNTLGKPSVEKLLETNVDLYQDSWQAVNTNMKLIAPIVYTGIDINLLDHSINPLTIQPDKIAILLFVHNLLYYYIHKTSHKNQKLYKYHKFHHRFDKLLIPSSGNAVSIPEFVVAYLFPFIVGAKIVHPSELSFIISVAIIAGLNLVIHCEELKNISYWKYLVSPNDHLDHHKKKGCHYAAPLLNLDTILENSNK